MTISIINPYRFVSAGGGISSSTLNDANLIAFYPMDESSGNMLDASGNGYNGTLTGSITQNGTIADGYTFAGGYVSIPDVAPFLDDNSAVTIAVWLKMNSAASYQRVVKGRISSANQHGLGLQVRNETPFNGALTTWISAAAPECFIDSNVSKTNNTWKLFAFTVTATGSELWVDGSFFASNTGTNCATRAAQTLLYLGNDEYSNEPYGGGMRMAFFSSRELTTDEHTFLFNGGDGRTW